MAYNERNRFKYIKLHNILFLNTNVKKSTYSHIACRNLFIINDEHNF